MPYPAGSCTLDRDDERPDEATGVLLAELIEPGQDSDQVNWQAEHRPCH